MNNRTLALVVLLFVLALSLGDLAVHYAAMPERIASHFGANGQPNGWSDKSSLASFTIGIFAFDSILFIVIALVTPYFPDATINLPNKAYWLAPERRKATMDFLSGHMLGFGAATQALMAGVFHQLYRANMTSGPKLGDSVPIYLAIYIGFAIWWAIDMVRHFSKPN